MKEVDKMKIFKKIYLIILCLFVCLFVSCDSKESNVKDAISIISIEKTSSEGLVDTYTIYYSDGTTSTFQITNGSDGKDGIDGKDGKDGLTDGISISSIEKTKTEGLVDTYTIYFNNGTSTTFEITNGKDGVNGSDGKDGTSSELTVLDAYNTYKELYNSDISYEEFLSLFINSDEKKLTNLASVINNCLRSVVKIYCPYTTGRNYGCSAGAGIIYKIDSEYTYIVTNYHVVYTSSLYSSSTISSDIHCYLYGSEGSPTSSNTGYTWDSYAIECEYIGGAINYDLAMVRAKTEDIYNINENVCAVEFADDYYVGETAIAIGNPNDEGISVTKGIVSVDNEYITLAIDNTKRQYRSIRIDTALYSGNSGGGLFNEEGQIIGLANAGSTDDENINYAIPLNIVKNVCENILYYATDNDDLTQGVYKITLGVTVTSQNSKYVYDSSTGYGTIKEEIVIKEVLQDSISNSLGLKENDIIKSIIINDKEYLLNRYFDLGDILISLKENDIISIKYERDGLTYNSSNYNILNKDLTNVS